MMQRCIALFGLAILVGLPIAVLWLQQAIREEMTTPNTLEAPVQYTVAPGSGLRQVAQDLHGNGLLRHPRYWTLAVLWRRQQEQLQAGEYRFLPAATPAEVLEQLVRGRVMLHTVTIPESWTFRRMMQELRRHPSLRQTLAGSSEAEIMAALGTPERAPEGMFFPDTYHFPKGTSELSILRLAHRKMQQVLAEEWEQRAPGLPYASAYEALILASVIDKETGLASERARIAGVFVRRLQRGMRLQADPTVIYALGEDFQPPLRRAALKIDTPFNTYRPPGLPPTPISLPSRAAIHAALHPEEGEALYFVANGDGGHHFSATLREHNRIRQLLRRQRP